MDSLEIIFLALIQGLTEFLPISSSAHLILPSQLLGFKDQGLAFDVAVHLGSLFAVVLYFRKDVNVLTRAWFSSIANKHQTKEATLAWCVVIGTIPAVIVGFFMDSYMDGFRSIVVIATTTVLFGILLGIADKMGVSTHKDTFTFKDALIIGSMQVLALIPGTSRSGITMTAALMLGFTREASARFSFLLSIPLILAAATLKTKDLVGQTGSVDWLSMGVGLVLSFMSAYLCIHLFLKAINRMGFMPFVIYRLVLGAVLFLIYTLT